MKQVHTENFKEWARKVKAGDEILLSGTIYTARDAAHKRIRALLQEGKALPFPLTDAFIYYAGPTPSKNGLPIGSCGPTTSSRMDPYVAELMEAGLRVTIGKGDRAPAVYDAIRAYGGLYLCALGGAGALCSQAITEAEVIAFDELGCESVKRFTVKDFPLFVGIDTEGNSIFSK